MFPNLIINLTGRLLNFMKSQLISMKIKKIKIENRACGGGAGLLAQLHSKIFFLCGCRRLSPSMVTRFNFTFHWIKGRCEMWRSSETATTLWILSTAISSLSALSSAASWPDRIEDILLTPSLATADAKISAMGYYRKQRVFSSNKRVAC